MYRFLIWINRAFCITIYKALIKPKVPEWRIVMKDSDSRKMNQVILCIVVAALTFATMEVALKLAGRNMDSFQLTFLRFLLGGIVLAPPAVIESRRSGYKVNAKDLGWLLLVGIMGVAISMLAYQLGVLRCNASTAAPLMCTSPLFSMVIAHLFTSEKMDRDKWIAFCIGLVAIVFMLRPWDVQEGNTVAGFILMIFAAATFGAYSVMGKKSIGRIGTFTQTSISFFLGSMALLIALLAMGHPVMSGLRENWPLVVYAGVVVTGIGYFFYFKGIEKSDATTGSMAFFIKPAIAPIFAVIILHETILWNTVVGIILLITASAITIRDKFRK